MEEKDISNDKMNCKMCKSLMLPFIQGYLTDNLHNKILQHLEKCPDCMREYLLKASNMNVQLSFKPKVTAPVKINDSLYKSYVDALKAEDLTVLMNVKAVRDCTIECAEINETKDESESETFRDFSFFLIKKICQKVDLLEKCLTKEVSR